MCMYAYMYVHVFVCMYLYNVYIYVFVCMYLYNIMFLNIYICMYAYICKYVYICMYIFIVCIFFWVSRKLSWIGLFYSYTYINICNHL